MNHGEGPSNVPNLFKFQDLGSLLNSRDPHDHPWLKGKQVSQSAGEDDMDGTKELLQKKTMVTRRRPSIYGGLSLDAWKGISRQRDADVYGSSGSGNEHVIWKLVLRVRKTASKAALFGGQNTITSTICVKKILKTLS